ncbi:MAG: hypothetical protein ACRENW_00175, partial [Thermodesulfobacteriota bacterium]
MFQGSRMTYFVEAVSKHREPEPEVRRIGEYETVAEAMGVAQKAIEQFLRKEFKRGMSAGKLYALYEERGEHMFIFQDEAGTFNVPGFDHRDYART